MQKGSTRPTGCFTAKLELGETVAVLDHSTEGIAAVRDRYTGCKHEWVELVARVICSLFPSSKQASCFHR